MPRDETLWHRGARNSNQCPESQVHWMRELLTPLSSYFGQDFSIAPDMLNERRRHPNRARITPSGPGMMSTTLKPRRSREAETERTARNGHQSRSKIGASKSSRDSRLSVKSLAYGARTARYGRRGKDFTSSHLSRDGRRRHVDSSGGNLCPRCQDCSRPSLLRRCLLPLLAARRKPVILSG